MLNNNDTNTYKQKGEEESTANRLKIIKNKQHYRIINLHGQYIHNTWTYIAKVKVLLWHWSVLITCTVNAKNKLQILLKLTAARSETF